uniref:SGF29 C-terminal domain-containing protein n=1 Tax=Chaetoceros debilis TaxID=122233 RepID=A0A7S3QFE2_9STRA
MNVGGNIGPNGTGMGMAKSNNVNMNMGMQNMPQGFNNPASQNNSNMSNMSNDQLMQFQIMQEQAQQQQQQQQQQMGNSAHSQATSPQPLPGMMQNQQLQNQQMKMQNQEMQNQQLNQQIQKQLALSQQEQQSNPPNVAAMNQKRQRQNKLPSTNNSNTMNMNMNMNDQMNGPMNSNGQNPNSNAQRRLSNAQQQQLMKQKMLLLMRQQQHKQQQQQEQARRGSLDGSGTGGNGTGGSGVGIGNSNKASRRNSNASVSSQNMLAKMQGNVPGMIDSTGSAVGMNNMGSMNQNNGMDANAGIGGNLIGGAGGMNNNPSNGMGMHSTSPQKNFGMNSSNNGGMQNLNGADRRRGSNNMNVNSMMTQQQQLQAMQQQMQAQMQQAAQQRQQSQAQAQSQPTSQKMQQGIQQQPMLQSVPMRPKLAQPQMMHRPKSSSEISGQGAGTTFDENQQEAMTKMRTNAMMGSNAQRRSSASGIGLPGSMMQGSMNIPGIGLGRNNAMDMVGGNTNGTMNPQMFSEMNNNMNGPMSAQMNGQMSAQMSAQMNAQMNGQMNGQMNQRLPPPQPRRPSLKTASRMASGTNASRDPNPHYGLMKAEDAIPLIESLPWEEKLIYLSRHVMGGRKGNGFFRAVSTLNKSRSKMLKEGELSTAKRKVARRGGMGGIAMHGYDISDGENASIFGGLSTTNDLIEPSQELAILKESPDIASNMLVEMGLGVTFCNTITSTIKSILKEIDSPEKKLDKKMPTVSEVKSNPQKGVKTQIPKAAVQPSAPPSIPFNLPPSLKKRRPRKIKDPIEECAPADPLAKKCSKKDLAHRHLNLTRFRPLRAGDFVAYKKTGNDSVCLLGTVVSDWHPTQSLSPNELMSLTDARRKEVFSSMVAVLDMNQQKKNSNVLGEMVSRQYILPLPQSHEEGNEWMYRCRKGFRVYAMDPQTSSFHPATVLDSTTYCEDEDNICIIEFDMKDSSTGGTKGIQRHVPARFVTLIPRDFSSSTKPRAKAPSRKRKSAASSTAGKKGSGPNGKTNAASNKASGRNKKSAPPSATVPSIANTSSITSSNHHYPQALQMQAHFQRNKAHRKQMEAREMQMRSQEIGNLATSNGINNNDSLMQTSQHNNPTVSMTPGRSQLNSHLDTDPDQALPWDDGLFEDMGDWEKDLEGIDFGNDTFGGDSISGTPARRSSIRQMASQTQQL